MVGERAGPAIGPPAVVVREVDIDGCLSLYQRTSDRVLVLNETASDVWRLIDGTLGEDEIVATLARSYGVDPSVIAGEVRATIRRFVEEGFLGLTLR
jgi:hypothetical protein